MNKNLKMGRINFSFFLAICCLILFGAFCLLSASVYDSEKFSGNPQALFTKQAQVLLIGFGLMLIGSMFDYRWLKKLAWPLIIVSVACLLAVKFSPFGLTLGGSERWLKLGPLSFQPSEFAKFACLLLLADGLSKASWAHSNNLLRLVAIVFSVGLILKQPDLGTSILILGSSALMLFVSGMNILITIPMGAAALFGAYYSIKHNAYQMARIEAWLKPEADPLGGGYNLLQSYYAIGSGGVWGSGYGQSVQKLGYLPISYADFIYAIICEELGFVGSLIIFCLFVYILWTGVQISLNCPTRFGKLLGLGLVFSLMIQTLFNLGGVVGLLPVTGMTLPFVSYGKTSVIVLGGIFGVLLSISRHQLKMKEISSEEQKPLKEKTLKLVSK